ncbi:MAG: hypothetical protein JSV85_07625 [Candidatus Bathyarchaeota archaeon]|nr:MAG: hypothetical protein JSV85_07625 [Candidatus Bathyarchaeota archaeon]
MTSGVKRNFSSLIYLVQKTYQKIVTARPSILAISAIMVATSIFLLAGGVYNLLEQPLTLWWTGERFIFYFPYSLNEQFALESVFIMIFYALGAVGFLLTYQSTKYAYSPRQAFILLSTGSLLIFAAYICVEYVFTGRFR